MSLNKIEKTQTAASKQLKGSEDVEVANKEEQSGTANHESTCSHDEDEGYKRRTREGERVHALPKIEGKEKTIISYEGDKVVRMCKSSNYTPITWNWYLTNGKRIICPMVNPGHQILICKAAFVSGESTKVSHLIPNELSKIAINESLLSDKYVNDRVPANTTHLKILKLTKEDCGAYWCEAVFKLGKSRGKLKLTVLTFMVPLTPFLAIVAEVVILVVIIFLCEVYSKKKEKRA
ncbi:PREDICTED: embigin-like, partial [Tinamus guttatus]|uniref:embigin-like n=1 Tax=Tinamus guttatus TaxID=94827 RepID=UPI00052EC9CE